MLYVDVALATPSFEAGSDADFAAGSLTTAVASSVSLPARFCLAASLAVAGSEHGAGATAAVSSAATSE